MSLWQVVQFLSDQWPALLVLLFNYWQGMATRADQRFKNEVLEERIKEAHEKIDKANAGKSAADIIDEFLKRTAK